ncbi:MAG: glycosyltransferase family 2 protein [Akkermansiaceae bacterium]|jgi:GT2 family glycosyltransferase|nr:glycosyltransferase family 2 protein [Akkermansiaceae bacterium]
MISVVIPSYNRRDCILRLLTDLRAQQGVEFEVIVVDDCSSDDTIHTLQREFPGVTLLINERNGGPCVSRNRGVLAAKGEIIVGFDSDVSVPDTGLLAKVALAFAEAPAATGFAFRIFEPDGVTDDAPRWWHPLPVGTAKDCAFETDYFSGTGYAFRRESMILAGLYPEILYMHYEEVELAWRILDRGGSIRYQPDLTVLHHANPVSRRSEIKVFYKPRNQFLLALRCMPLGRGLGFLLPRLAYGLFQALRHRALGDWWRAMLSARELAPRCLADRKALYRSTWNRISAMKRQSGGAFPDTESFGKLAPVATTIAE